MPPLMTTDPQSSGTTVRKAPPAWAVMLAVCAGQFLVVLDVSVVNVAMPSMRSSLGLSELGLQWVVNAYVITFAGFLMLGGRAADLFGRKRVFLIGLALFTAASLGGGLAQESWQLIAARTVQGIGAAVLAPATLTILTTSFPQGPARTRAVATWTAVGAGGGAAGGLVGGLLTQFLSWRWVLLINVPIGALVLAGAAYCLTESRQEGRRRLDVPGALLVTGGLALVAYGIVQTGERGWTAAGALLPLLAGLVVLGAFVAVEARSKAPLMPLGVFRPRSVWATTSAMVVVGAGMFSMWYFLSLYTQNVLGYSALQAGLSFLPHSFSIVIGSKVAPRLMALPRIGAKTVAVAGVLLATVGMAWQSTMDAHGTYLGTILGPGITMALGAGLSATPIAAICTAGAAAGDAGLVSGLINTSRQMGGALGLSILSTAAAGVAGSGRVALADGYALAFRVAAVVLLASVLLMMFSLPGRTKGDGATDGARA
ncbi:MFS transporter [Streptomyces sp. NPDC042319]|uniref:MFS transporter n=1 Tax=Streptomyces sp. NPDC042319 TaxID=3154332 RepID=UPI003402B2C1